MRLLYKLALLFIILGLSACASVYKAKNPSIESFDHSSSYRLSKFKSSHDIGENLVILAFSGGGTRAAALSYGVLQELRSTELKSANNLGDHTLLADVDLVSSVSGGSFTAAYYAAFGDEIFQRFETDFLRQDIQGSLVSRFLSPRHWFRSLVSGFDRTEMAIEFYDRTVFRGKTFADLSLNQHPLTLINATDLSTGAGFSFEQDQFDWICGDLDSVSLARAVTASSAVPIAFPPVVLKNHGSECDIGGSPVGRHIANLRASGVRQESVLSALHSYRDAEKRPYIHLVDGGISDNLGLRVIADQLSLYTASHDEVLNPDLKRVVLILVNSSVHPSRAIDLSPETPAFTDTINAVTDALMGHVEADTRAYFFDQASAFKFQLAELRPDVDFYLAEVSFRDLPDASSRNVFNNLPTSFSLNDAQIDALIAAGRALLREEPEFKKLKQDIQAQLTGEGASSNYVLEQEIKKVREQTFE